MKHAFFLRNRRFFLAVSVKVLFTAGLLACIFAMPIAAQEGKYDIVYESLHDTPASPEDEMKTAAPEPVPDEALSLHPDVDTRNADDLTTSISNRDEMPPILSLPTSSRSSLDAGINRKGPVYDSPSEFHRVTDSNHKDDDVYYLNLNIRF